MNSYVWKMWRCVQQRSLIGNNNIYELLRLENVAMCTAAVAHLELLIRYQNCIFRQNGRIHAFLLLLSINQSTCLFNIVVEEVSTYFWTVPEHLVGLIRSAVLCFTAQGQSDVRLFLKQNQQKQIGGILFRRCTYGISSTHGKFRRCGVSGVQSVFRIEL